MREIKFRIWDKAFNFYVPYPEIQNPLPNNPTLDIEQYTGFTDKLGKEIYEGDIVLSKGLSNRNSWDAYSHKGMENNNIRIVTWVDNGWGIVDFKLGRVTAGIGLKTATQKRFEVIGNIHENENLIS